MQKIKICRLEAPHTLGYFQFFFFFFLIEEKQLEDHLLFPCNIFLQVGQSHAFTLTLHKFQGLGETV